MNRVAQEGSIQVPTAVTYSVVDVAWKEVILGEDKLGKGNQKAWGMLVYMETFKEKQFLEFMEIAEEMVYFLNKGRKFFHYQLEGFTHLRRNYLGGEVVVSNKLGDKDLWIFGRRKKENVLGFYWSEELYRSR